MELARDLLWWWAFVLTVLKILTEVLDSLFATQSVG